MVPILGAIMKAPWTDLAKKGTWREAKLPLVIQIVPIEGLDRLVGSDTIPPYPDNVRLGLTPFLCNRTDIETRPH
jgi:hypothetical protein